MEVGTALALGSASKHRHRFNLCWQLDHRSVGRGVEHEVIALTAVLVRAKQLCPAAGGGFSGSELHAEAVVEDHLVAKVVHLAALTVTSQSHRRHTHTPTEDARTMHGHREQPVRNILFWAA
jgi:hypothetical protein